MTAFIKKIIHIDMDAFFASVEQRDNPGLKGKPVAVGGSSGRGVVAAASYEARSYGVYSAMPSVTAKKKCPELIFIKPRFDVYKSVSNQIRNIFLEYTDLVEPLSLDEAYLDVTENKKNMRSATMIAREIKQKIVKETGLTASAGISINKFLAKIASDIKKPDGLFLIPPDKVEKFIEELPIEKFFGVGKVTARKMHTLGIRNGLDLKNTSKEKLLLHFGKHGLFYYKIARAEDDREVNPNRIRKSIGAENTFPNDLTNINSLISEMDKIMDTLHHRIIRSGVQGKTVTVKIKYADFQIITRSRTVHHWIYRKESIRPIYLELIKNLEIGQGIRLLGLTLSNLNHQPNDTTSNSEGAQLTFEF